MVLIGIGANLPGVGFATPLETCEAAIKEMGRRGLAVSRRSRWCESAPVPPSGQPRFVNGAVALEDGPPPRELLDLLHAIERDFGRERRERNEARALDLDLLAWGDVAGEADGVVLPHPRLHQRAFVLMPLSDAAPDWVHPTLGLDVREMLANLSFRNEDCFFISEA